MPEEEKGTHLHHPEGPIPGEIIGVKGKGERQFATSKEFRESLKGVGAEVRRKAKNLRKQLRLALEAKDREKVVKVLERADRLVDKEPELEYWVELMEGEATGKAPLGEAYLERKERGKALLPEERPADRKPEEIRRIPDEIGQEKDKEGVLLDPRTEKMKWIEGRYFLWVEEPKLTIKEVEEQYLRYLAGIGAREPTPGQGIAGREWEEVARYTAEVDAIIRTTEDNEVKEKAQWLKRFAQAYYHELEYYHRFWYGEVEGIGKGVYRPKEGSRLILINQWVPLLTHPEYGKDVEKHFKEQTGYKREDELIDEVNDPYGLKRLGHHLRRYSLAPMFRDAYEEGIRIRRAEPSAPDKPDEYKPTAPGYGKSYEYSLYGVYYTTAWAKENNPRAYETLLIKDAEGNVIMDLGKLGATYDMFSSPVRRRLYLLNWEHIGKRNQIRLTAGREWLWLGKEARDDFLPEERSEKLRDLLWKDKAGILTKEEREGMEKLVGTTFSEAEIKILQQILQKQIKGEQITLEEKGKMKEFMDVILRNLLNRDLGIDPNDLDLIRIFENPQSSHERVMPNDILTNILVEVRRMEQTKDDLTSGAEAFISQPSFERILALEAQRYAHLGDVPWLKEEQINQLREIVTRMFLAGVISEIRYSGSALFEEKRKQIYDTLKANASVGLHGATLKEIYGIDFTNPSLREKGTPLSDVVEKLIQVHGEGNLRRIYLDRGEDWVIRVIDEFIKTQRGGTVREEEKASEADKERFNNRFGFNDYTTFEVGIIEEPVLNSMGVTRRRLGEMTDRERTRNLWLAKKGMLPGEQGIWIKSRDQHLRAGWEELKGARREGGTWIYGLQPETEESERVGYKIGEPGEEVFWRRITSEDPIQHDLFWVEQMIYSRNSELISAHLSNQSAMIKENPNEWLTPPERRALIDKHRSVLDIDDGRAVELMRIHGCRDGDTWLWTAKSWVLTYALEPIARAFPGVQQFQTGRRVPANLAGLGVSGGVGLWTFTQWAAAGPLAAGPLSMVASAVALIPASWALRRLARVREIPLFHWPAIGLDFRIGPFGIGPDFMRRLRRINFQLRLPFFWLREGKEPTPLE